MTKKFQIMSQGQKLARLDEEYLPSHYISDANIQMPYVQGGDLYARKTICLNDQLWLSYHILNNVPNYVQSFLLPLLLLY